MGIWRSLLRTSIWVFPTQPKVAYEFEHGLVSYSWPSRTQTRGRAFRGYGFRLRTRWRVFSLASKSSLTPTIPNTSKMLSHRDVSTPWKTHMFCLAKQVAPSACLTDCRNTILLLRLSYNFLPVYDYPYKTVCVWKKAWYNTPTTIL